MEVSYELTLEDLRAYLAWSATQPPASKQFESSRIMGTAVFILMAAIFALGGLLGPGRLLAVMGFVMLLAAVLVWFTLPGRLVSSYAQRTVTAMASGKLGYLVGPRKARIDDAGIALSGPGLALSYSWQLVDRIALAPGGVYLYLGAQQAHVVPRSAFASEEEMRRLADMAEAFRGATLGQRTSA